MRLRHLFIITFCLVALIPMILFWVWPYSKALESELEDVKERHLVIAKNLAGAFERYYLDVTGLFTIVDSQLSLKENKKFAQIFSNYGFQSVMIISKNGDVNRCIYQASNMCQSKISKDILDLSLSTLVKDEVRISTVTEDKDSGPILLVVKEDKEGLVLAYLSTDYIVNMGRRVAFGKKGHAAVVDQAGNVLAHPLDSWIASRKNISKVSAVKKMISGQTGVEIFYSPALKDDMIAGYTAVSNANWGVMVPQPVAELRNKANDINNTAMFVFVLGLGLALLITIPISFILIKPIERLSSVIKSISRGDSDEKIVFVDSKYFPLEIKQLKSGFIKMMANIHENKKAISQLAYIDMITCLPNRNYFQELTNRSFSEMAERNEKAALVFIDFDGFKNVNDTYGHRTGDELLSLFARRIKKHFDMNKKFEHLFDLNDLPDAIPARLGGDEFVILYKNVKDEEEVKEKTSEFFKDVFCTYELYGNIKVDLTGSAGVAMFPKDGNKYNEILKSADIAMYDAKAAGKNTIRFFKANKKS